MCDALTAQRLMRNTHCLLRTRQHGTLVKLIFIIDLNQLKCQSYNYVSKTLVFLGDEIWPTKGLQRIIQKKRAELRCSFKPPNGTEFAIALKSLHYFHERAAHNNNEI